MLQNQSGLCDTFDTVDFYRQICRYAQGSLFPGRQVLTGNTRIILLDESSTHQLKSKRIKSCFEDVQMTGKTGFKRRDLVLNEWLNYSFWYPLLYVVAFNNHMFRAGWTVLHSAMLNFEKCFQK